VTDFPRSLIEFQHRFPDEAACAAYLFAARWPDGFVCPGCGKTKALAAGQPSSCRPTCESAPNRDPARDWSYHIESMPIISVLVGSPSAPIGTPCHWILGHRIKVVTHAGAGSRFGADSQHQGRRALFR
jgi:hypothetical protein